MKTVLLVLITCSVICAQSEQTFPIPDINIQALVPKGLIVSFPDSPGIELFAFHGNVNEPIKGKEDGTINKQIPAAQDGVWSFTDPTVQLKAGDTVHYWIFVQHQRVGFSTQEQFPVTSMNNLSLIHQIMKCPKSYTEVTPRRPDFRSYRWVYKSTMYRECNWHYSTTNYCWTSQIEI
ncbi:uncharacterized protein CBL_20034 [Carabus blaptoides fortunei]